MKKMFIAAALIVSGLLSACNQLTQYSVSEQEINQALQKRNHFAKDIGLPGVADAHIELQNLTSAIGREFTFREPESDHRSEAQSAAGFQ